MDTVKERKCIFFSYVFHICMYYIYICMRQHRKLTDILIENKREKQITNFDEIMFI